MFFLSKDNLFAKNLLYYIQKSLTQDRLIDMREHLKSALPVYLAEQACCNSLLQLLI